ncbi:hypothetical protein ACQKGC_15850 [Allorhizobium pseudoryzae]|uniref:hypothetical protein n=1 Tax=Allorhizobium pseudoryzae TaxID=379684 RepID=UPI003D0791A6
MRATDHLSSILAKASENFSEDYKRWVKVMHWLGTEAGIAHLQAASSLAHIDIILRQVETEHLEEVSGPDLNSMSYTTMFVEMLSRSWVLIAYEIVRVLADRKRDDRQIIELKKRLAAVRIPLAKAEIEGADRFQKRNGGRLPPVLSYPMGEDPRISGWTYAHDGSHTLQTAVCNHTGAIVWRPFDLVSKQEIEVCRRDLSDEFLNLAK